MTLLEIALFLQGRGFKNARIHGDRVICPFDQWQDGENYGIAIIPVPDGYYCYYFESYAGSVCGLQWFNSLHLALGWAILNSMIAESELRNELIRVLP